MHADGEYKTLDLTDFGMERFENKKLLVYAGCRFMEMSNSPQGKERGVSARLSLLQLALLHARLHDCVELRHNRVLVERHSLRILVQSGVHVSIEPPEGAKCGKCVCPAPPNHLLRKKSSREKASISPTASRRSAVHESAKPCFNDDTLAAGNSPATTTSAAALHAHCNKNTRMTLQASATTLSHWQQTASERQS